MSNMPPKIDKSHGFMKSIIKNQVSRDEYDKEQKVLAQMKEIQQETDAQAEARKTSAKRERSTRTPKRAPIQLYVPPHVKNKATDERKDSTPSPKNSPEPSKRISSDNNASKRDSKRTKRTIPSQQDTSSTVLFKFEYENESEDVRTFYVREGDNAEDLAETFGNQLGLTKSLKRALQHKLNYEIKKCTNS